MTIQQRDIGDVVVVDVHGKIMGGPDSDALKAALRDLMERGTHKVLVNLGDVTWINSSGLGILIEGFSELRRQGGSLKLVHVPPRIESLLTVTKLSTIFESYRQEDEAVRSFA